MTAPRHPPPTCTMPEMMSNNITSSQTMVVSVEWDNDSDTVLPTQVEIPEMDHDLVSDYLSDLHGFCVKDWTMLVKCDCCNEHISVGNLPTANCAYCNNYLIGDCMVRIHGMGGDVMCKTCVDQPVDVASCCVCDKDYNPMCCAYDYCAMDGDFKSCCSPKCQHDYDCDQEECEYFEVPNNPTEAQQWDMDRKAKLCGECKPKCDAWIQSLLVRPCTENDNCDCVCCG